MADKFNLKLVTLTGIKVDKDVYEVLLPTVDGEIGVFPGHEPLVTMASQGAIMIRENKEDDDEKLEFLAISGGVIEINQKRVRVLVDEADYSEDIVEAEAKAALDRAMQMRDEATSQVELEKATALIDRHQIRLNVAGLRRRRRQR